MQINAVGAQSASSPVSFDRVMQGALNHVDQFQQVAEQKQTAIEMGKSDDLAGRDDRQSAGIVIVFRAGAGT
jgi:flagellar hook-basal body complex protein FliE